MKKNPKKEWGLKNSGEGDILYYWAEGKKKEGEGQHGLNRYV